jgi:hypothetical protein
MDGCGLVVTAFAVSVSVPRCVWELGREDSHVITVPRDDRTT